jgi:hypothetical protein
MTDMNGCQIPCLPRMAGGAAEMEPQPFITRLKRLLAKPWNYHVKRWAKQIYRSYFNRTANQQALTREGKSQMLNKTVDTFAAGDIVRVHSREEIETTLDPWKELKGCAFLDSMWEYCGTTQRVLQPVERFLDERDYKVKKCRGVVLLEDLLCTGTPVFGRCDRRCHLFWRAEWLEKMDDGWGDRLTLS